jgi:hypothetical protein
MAVRAGRLSATTSTPLLRRVMPRGMLLRELLVALTRPRALVIKVCVPLLLTVPLLAGHAPTFWAAMLLTVMCAMVGTVGSAVTVSRARESGLLTRLALTPRGARRVVVEWMLGGTAVDALQLAPVIAVVLVLAPVTPAAGVALCLAALAVLLLANGLGTIVAAAGGGPGEVLLDVMIVLAPLLFLGGLFTGVPREGWRWVVAIFDPFTYAHSAFIGALGGAPVFTAAIVDGAACVTAVAALVLVALCAPLVLRRR